VYVLEGFTVSEVYASSKAGRQRSNDQEGVTPLVTTATGSCALCASAAIITDWGPVQDWLAVEGCLCDGFFIEKRLWDGRLLTMPTSDREAFAARLRAWRATRRKAWVSTTDGRLVITPERPARST
jgi:hypothetical protein